MSIWRGQPGRTAVMGTAFAVFVVCCLLPVVYLLATTLSAGHDLVLDSRQRGLLYNTTILGLGTAVLATAVGAPLGIVLARVPLRRKALARLLAGAPVLLHVIRKERALGGVEDDFAGGELGGGTLDR